MTDPRVPQPPKDPKWVPPAIVLAIAIIVFLAIVL